MTIWFILFVNLMAGIIFTCLYTSITLSNRTVFKETLYYYNYGISNLFTTIFGSCLGAILWVILLTNLWFIIIPGILTMAYVHYRKHHKEGSAE